MAAMSTEDTEVATGEQKFVPRCLFGDRNFGGKQLRPVNALEQRERRLPVPSPDCRGQPLAWGRRGGFTGRGGGPPCHDGLGCRRGPAFAQSGRRTAHEGYRLVTLVVFGRSLGWQPPPQTGPLRQSHLAGIASPLQPFQKRQDTKGRQRTNIFPHLFGIRIGRAGFLGFRFRPSRLKICRKGTQNHPKQAYILNFRPLRTYFEDEAATSTPRMDSPCKARI